MHFWLNAVQGPEGRTGPRIFVIGRHHGDRSVLGHGPGQHVEALRIDAVVVGDQDSHGAVLSRRSA